MRKKAQLRTKQVKKWQPVTRLAMMEALKKIGEQKLPEYNERAARTAEAKK